MAMHEITVLPWEDTGLGRTHDASAYVYHYTTEATACTHILPHSTLRLGPLSKVNDPYESQVWRIECPGLDTSDARTQEQWNEALAHIRELKQRIKVLCMAGDEVDSSPSLPNLSDLFVDMGFAHPRMWAQYAGNHTGVCLMFERERLSQAVRSQLKSGSTLHEGQVQYGRFHDFYVNSFGKEFLAFEPRVFAEHFVRTRLQSLVFAKWDDWADEHEYRWVVRGDASGEEFVSYGDTLRCVILGARVAPDHRAAVASMCSLRGIPVRAMAWANGRPLSPHPLVAEGASTPAWLDEI